VRAHLSVNEVDEVTLDVLGSLSKSLLVLVA
jgi:hypothetical protein